MILQYLRKEKQGQIGERNKTIILLRASTDMKPPEVASGERSGSVGQLVRLSNKKPQRTQQNDRGFVALAGEGSRKGRAHNVNDVSSLHFPDCQKRGKAAPVARTPVDIRKI